MIKTIIWIINQRQVKLARKKLSEDKAKSIALKDASVTEADAQMLSVTQDNEDGKAVYEIEFQNKDQEYSYTIDANSGDIVEKSSEPIND